MSGSDSSKGPPPVSRKYTDLLVKNLSRRNKTARVFDLIPSEIVENPHLKKYYYSFLHTDTVQPPASQANVLVITLRVIIMSFASDPVLLRVALLTLTKALVGGFQQHVATDFGGYFLLLNAFDLRLYDEQDQKAVDWKGSIHPERMYSLSGVGSPTRLRVESEEADDSKRIEILPLVQFWYNLTLHMTDGDFNIGEFVNNLCGAVGMSINEDKGALTNRLPANEAGGSFEQPINIARRAIGSSAGLPPLHLLSI